MFFSYSCFRYQWLALNRGISLQEHQAGTSCINKTAQQTYGKRQRTGKAQGWAQEWWLGQEMQEDKEVLPGFRAHQLSQETGDAP